MENKSFPVERLENFIREVLCPYGVLDEHTRICAPKACR
jgi:hypothetical protein